MIALAVEHDNPVKIGELTLRSAPAGLTKLGLSKIKGLSHLEMAGSDLVQKGTMVLKRLKGDTKCPWQ